MNPSVDGALALVRATADGSSPHEPEFILVEHFLNDADYLRSFIYLGGY